MIKGLRTRVILALAVLGAVATGCSSEEPGDPTPQGSDSTSTERTSQTTSTKPSSGGASLTDFDACEAVNSVATQLNLTEIEVDGDACDAEFSATVSVTVEPKPDLKIDEAVGKELSDIDVGPRKAKLVKAPATDSSCLVAIEVTETDRVDVIAVANASQDEACDAATKVATAIEPKLPK